MFANIITLQLIYSRFRALVEGGKERREGGREGGREGDGEMEGGTE